MLVARRDTSDYIAVFYIYFGGLPFSIESESSSDLYEKYTANLFTESKPTKKGRKV
jgi:hypothetical protein